MSGYAVDHFFGIADAHGYRVVYGNAYCTSHEDSVTLRNGYGVTDAFKHGNAFKHKIRYQVAYRLTHDPATHAVNDGHSMTSASLAGRQQQPWHGDVCRSCS